MRVKVSLAAAHRIIDIGQVAADLLNKKLSRKLHWPTRTSRRERLDPAFLAGQALQFIHPGIGKLSLPESDRRPVSTPAGSYFARPFAHLCPGFGMAPFH